MASPFDYLKAINEKKDITVDDSVYSQYILNRAFSNFADTIFYANMANEMGEMSNEMHYDFLNGLISKKKRFSKWKKPTKDQYLEKISEFYGVSHQVAKMYSKILSQEEKEQLMKDTNNG